MGWNSAPPINPPERDIEDDEVLDNGPDTWKEAEGIA